MSQEKRHIWLVRTPLHDGRWKAWPPDLLERVAAALMFRRVPAQILDTAVRPLAPVELAALARAQRPQTIAFWSDRVEHRTVVAWLSALREAVPDQALAVIGPCGEAAPFLHAGANLVVRGEADNAVDELPRAAVGETRELTAPPAMDPASWPLPAREHLPPGFYFDRTVPAAHPPLAVVEWSRPDPLRQRDPVAVAGEIDLLRQTGQARTIALLAEDVGANRPQLSQLARLVGVGRPRMDLLVDVRPQAQAADLARDLRWCGVVLATVDLGDLREPGLAEQTCRALRAAGLLVRVRVEAARPEPVLRAAVLLARRARVNDVIFVGESRREETTRARKRFLQRPEVMGRNLVAASLRRPLWWIDVLPMARLLVER